MSLNFADGNSKESNIFRDNEQKSSSFCRIDNHIEAVCHTFKSFCKTAIASWFVNRNKPTLLENKLKKCRVQCHDLLLKDSTERPNELWSYSMSAIRFSLTLSLSFIVHLFLRSEFRSESNKRSKKKMAFIEWNSFDHRMFCFEYFASFVCLIRSSVIEFKLSERRTEKYFNGKKKFRTFSAFVSRFAFQKWTWNVASAQTTGKSRHENEIQSRKWFQLKI